MRQSCYFTGIDEAGLGPLLGPFCTGAVQVYSPEGTSLYEGLASISDRKIVKNPPLPIEDSKKLYTPSKGLAVLEKSVLAVAYYYSGHIPETLEDFLTIFLSDRIPFEELRALPWYRQIHNTSLPLGANINDIENSASQLSKAFAKSKQDFSSIEINLATEKKINSLINQWDNKALACRQVLAPLIQNSSINQPAKIIIDQQGGRRYYGSWLLDIFPGQRIQVKHELAHQSIYQLDNCEIVFQTHADAEYMETSLASMFAKYTRETLMTIFNQYWTGRFPEIKPTAGYTTDGKRFIKDLIEQKVDPYIIKTLSRSR